MSDSCIGCPMHLSVCKAECCKEFRLGVNPRQRLRRGDTFRLVNNDADFELYCNLRGFKSDNVFIYVTLDKFEVRGRFVYIIAPCSLLTDDGLCSAHGEPHKRPVICDYPNVKEGSGNGAVYITSNCLYGENGGIREKWQEQEK